MPADRNLKFERSNHALTLTRQFDASAEQVFRAHTEVPLIQKWLLGMPGWTMPECIYESRTGGRFRYTWAHPEQAGFTIEGDILHIIPNQRIVNTERFDGVDMGGETIVTTHFDEEDGVTTMRMCIIYDDPGVIDTVLATGMTDGMQLSYENLDRLVAS